MALRYIKQFNINRIISGEKGKDFPTIYTEGGTSEFGNDLLISLSPEELGNDDYYKIGSQLYKFISNFVSLYYLPSNKTTLPMTMLKATYLCLGRLAKTW